MKNIKETLIALAKNPLMTEEDVLFEMVKLAYKAHGRDTMRIFLQLQDMERKENEDRERILMGGVEDAMHGLSSMGEHLLVDKNSRKAKKEAELYLVGDNISWTIRTCMAYFRKGHAGFASPAGKWFFNNFRDRLVTNRAKYSPGGSSRAWAEQLGYDKYIDLVLQKYDEEQTK